MYVECIFTEGEQMATARTDDGIEVTWTSTSLGAEVLNAALNRGVYELLEADEQDVFPTRTSPLSSKRVEPTNVTA